MFHFFCFCQVDVGTFFAQKKYVINPDFCLRDDSVFVTDCRLKKFQLFCRPFLELLPFFLQFFIGSMVLPEVSTTKFLSAWIVWICLIILISDSQKSSYLFRRCCKCNAEFCRGLWALLRSTSLLEWTPWSALYSETWRFLMTKYINWFAYNSDLTDVWLLVNKKY